MKKALALSFLLLGVAYAGAKKTASYPPENLLWTSYRNSGLSNGGTLGGRLLATRAFVVTAVNVSVASVGGGGAGTSVITITDGTNNCLVTMTCALSAANGRYRTGTTAGLTLSGACTFAPGADVRATVTTAGCTTTQPTVNNIDVLGIWP